MAEFGGDGGGGGGEVVGDDVYVDDFDGYWKGEVGGYGVVGELGLVVVLALYHLELCKNTYPFFNELFLRPRLAVSLSK